jgi:hypothetical protein
MGLEEVRTYSRLVQHVKQQFLDLLASDPELFQKAEVDSIMGVVCDLPIDGGMAIEEMLFNQVRLRGAVTLVEAKAESISRSRERQYQEANAKAAIIVREQLTTEGKRPTSDAVKELTAMDVMVAHRWRRMEKAQSLLALCEKLTSVLKERKDVLVQLNVNERENRKES